MIAGGTPTQVTVERNSLRTNRVTIRSRQSVRSEERDESDFPFEGRRRLPKSSGVGVVHDRGNGLLFRSADGFTLCLKDDLVGLKSRRETTLGRGRGAEGQGRMPSRLDSDGLD